jgi:hypothetical protein
MTMRDREQDWYVGGLAQFWALMAVGMVAAVAFMLFVMPSSVWAYATIEGPPTFSSAPGLPDGRVYEQVSPTDTNGNEAGATTNQYDEFAMRAHYALAAPEGNSVLFQATGAIGEAPDGYGPFYVASRSSSGWRTRAVLPRVQEEPAEKFIVTPTPLVGYIDPSQDLSHVMFSAEEVFSYPLKASCEYSQLYFSGPNPFEPATWLERPEISDPIENCSIGGGSGVPVGGTPNFSTVYFTVPGTLLPEDAERAPHTNGNEVVEAWGFYEDREGVLREAGVLPGGGVSPFGAVPAASGRGKALAGNQVSEDGERAFFVSPDPTSCEQNGGTNDCTTDPSELYVRENGEKTLLISRDKLLPTVDGLPVGAPSGVYPMSNPTQQVAEGDGGRSDSYVFASPDGSQAFFQSGDALTEEAQKLAPGSEPKTYDFNLETGVLTYLPGVEGQIVAVDKDGSSLAFVRPEAGGRSAELDLWSGPGAGSVTPVVQLPGLPSTGGDEVAPAVYVSDASLSNDGSALVFTTATGLSPSFNSGGLQQVYRYEAGSNELACVSCAPAGVTAEPASSSPLNLSEEGGEIRNSIGEVYGMVNERGISADGDRVFFQTRAQLVPQDTSSATPTLAYNGIYEPQGMNVYEWENGVVYLISGGKSERSSFYLDSGENGEDVFFATTEALTAGHTDGGYAVYDARIPHPGDNPPAAAVPCEGSVCQGPPRVQSPLSAPASATFSGLGNSLSESAVATTVTKKTTTRITCKKGLIKKKSKCVKSQTKKKARKVSSDRKVR